MRETTWDATGTPVSNFNAISLKLASPDRIREWSHGEVTKPETINYRTQRSERNGLFCEKIFGPEKDYECYCGKYRRIRYKDIVCEKCGVEVTRSIVRRERMGHIELSSPVAHIWFLRGVPSSKIGLLLDLSMADIEKVIYFAGYIVVKVQEDDKKKLLRELDQEFKSKMKSTTSDEAKEAIKQSLVDVRREIDSIREGMVLDEVQYHKFSLKYGLIFEASIGAEAVYKIFKSMDLDKEEGTIRKSLEEASAGARPKLLKRLQLVQAMRRSGIRPEWMFLTVIPVTPPAIRPMVALDGGRHATSDVNDLYRRVINRNNRLRRLIEINAPDVIQRNEKRILQEAVDALIDNSIRHGSSGGALAQAQRRPLKSLADMLKGKQGRFRQNLLGKRVDYSGRSVIVVGPDLKLHQCGLPKHMALELFRPFVIAKILERELAFNIRGAGKLIEEGAAEVWAILEEVIKNKYVLLNRAPTLHRLGIQAFQPVLIEGNAIRIHPLVCSAFNADFDGDQMAVHVPLGVEAQGEARDLMAANNNLLRPGSGDPIVTPKLDIVLGCYWMTKAIDGELGEGKIFPSINQAITAYDFGAVGFRSKIKVLPGSHAKYDTFEGKVFETTVGRLLFNSILPNDFPYINHEVAGGELSTMIQDLISRYGIEGTPAVLDKIKSFGYKYVTKSGITWGLDDLRSPPEKAALVAVAREEALRVEDNFAEGLISENERYRMSIEIWRGVKDAIEKSLPKTLLANGSIQDMILSGARGSWAQVSQMAGMIGLIVNTRGRTLDFPIIPSYKEGLSPLEYFIITHGSRKGLADTALNTAKSGYLTRRLVDVSQDCIIVEEDCGETVGRVMKKSSLVGIGATLGNAILGRILARDVKDTAGKAVVIKGTLLMKAEVKSIEESGVSEVSVRSPLTCTSIRGICRSCYGLDLGRNRLVNLGEAVGIIAAQSIGEPGTQLTMRTFHQGGISQEAGDITMGLPRVEEIFEKRPPKSPAIVSQSSGEVLEVREDAHERIITVLSDVETTKDAKQASVTYTVPNIRTVLVKPGDRVHKGDLLSDGSANLTELFAYGSKEIAEDYILNEIHKVYSLQGAQVSRKHVEVIVRQMFSRYSVLEPGDTRLVPGEVVSTSRLHQENSRAELAGGVASKSARMIKGITEVALTTQSFLSAASFQNTSRVLIDTAIKGGVDRLVGLKENVIIGRLIPAGTGYKPLIVSTHEEIS
ncbi:MAG: DNA-directed RNA polymerase subunit beta' [Candidatus Vogelbacteria bacterium CG10_big_fil_rev_8_21_14_0_10_51_16]|uniref:DNA-directed RNA polymerase subunit beta' n=1 Tax=Candidatus Vogelbacteria bacterium CG10_big_fil_rev_8_21_14_0_10_51_16 TaxID=1975045 RepID=A0A2H0RGY6_9BACT|nr:MAG: DNA-directed RNA polymerase subunit beta' [Candidatus Vogelbacteria bacterium CG10_big_fil_rev_8_21_14_0_10_51_16]